MKTIALITLSCIYIFGGAGVVWFLAMLFNPPITSNIVWFIGLVYGNLLWAIERPEAEKSWDEEFGG